jgi:DNA invertase Pin-like site-specific DNA recombinase
MSENLLCANTQSLRFLGHMAKAPPRPKRPQQSEPVALDDKPFELIRNRGGHNQLIGYARVSKPDQVLDSQIDVLSKAGCCRIYAEKICSVKAHRPGFAAMQETLRKGDTVVVAALDRLGRKMSELISTVEGFGLIGVHFRDLRNGINTQSAHGKLYMHILMALAESERELNRERTKDALAAARARGRMGGRPTLLTPAKIEHILHLHGKRDSVRRIAAKVGLTKSVVHRAIEVSRQLSIPCLERAARGYGLQPE